MRCLACVLVVAATGCALDESGVLPNEGGKSDVIDLDAPVLPDVSADSPPPPSDAGDAGPTDAPAEAPDPCLTNPHYFCRGSAVCHPGEDCAACGDGGVTPPLFCATDNTCYGDCTSCSGLSVECFRCLDAGTFGVCDTLTGGCITNPLPACDCSNGLSNCPGPTQVCVHSGPSHWCETCGAAGTDWGFCFGGNQCNESNGTCTR